MNLKRRVFVWILATTSLLLAGCAAQPIADLRVEVPKSQHKDIFIFVDGTGKSAKAPSNVRRLFDLTQMPGERKSTVVAFYMEGVGGARHPFTGKIAGKGISYRIAASYANLMRVYQPGDRIYIFGFSRGAHIARALSGLLAYAGLPILADCAVPPLADKTQGLPLLADCGAPSPTEKAPTYDSQVAALIPHSFDDYLAFAEKINDLARDADEDRYISSYWSKWASLAKIESELPAPPLEAHLQPLVNGYKGFAVSGFRPVPVEFIGVWDTVPGSVSREFADCREKMADGEYAKYKSNSYPNTKRIAHAVSWDEKRDRFEVLHVCRPIQWTKDTELDGLRPVVSEVAFPGAHSDVGGGYLDEDPTWQKENYDLPTLSFKWMLRQLSKTDFALSDADIDRATKPDKDLNPSGLAHWSLSGFANILLNDCKDRIFVSAGSEGDQRSVITVPDESIRQRESFGKVPLLIGERSESNQPLALKYPVTCDTYKERFKGAGR